MALTRNDIIHQKQFNGEFGCSICFHPEEYMRALKSRVYNFLPNQPQLRKKEIVNEIKLAVQNTGNIVFGIKGVLPLQNLISIPDNVPIDCIHAV